MFTVLPEYTNNILLHACLAADMVVNLLHFEIVVNACFLYFKYGTDYMYMYMSMYMYMYMYVCRH